MCQMSFGDELLSLLFSLFFVSLYPVSSVSNGIASRYVVGFYIGIVSTFPLLAVGSHR